MDNLRKPYARPLFLIFRVRQNLSAVLDGRVDNGVRLSRAAAVSED